jgi:hypothetical protein
VTISGSKFGTVIGKVTFAGASGTTVDATPSLQANWADTLIKVIVPANAKSGNVVVTPAGGGTPQIIGSFTVQ